MAIGTWLEGIIGGDKKFSRDWKNLGTFGREQFDAGKTLTDEGLGGIRSLDSTFQGRLADPLGKDVRGVFDRARGELGDDAIRRQRAYGSRITQRALQSGGRLSPEAMAELEQQNQRDINEELFTANNSLRGTEAELSLSETGKLFDRMTDLRKTVLGVGQDEKTRGLQAMIQSLLGRHNRLNAMAQSMVGGASVGVSGYAAGRQ